MIRGIGDPLVNIYARCYLVRIGQSIPNVKEYLKENFKDFIFIYGVVRRHKLATYFL